MVHQPEATAEATLTYAPEGPLSLTIVSKGPIEEGDGSGIGLQSLRERAASIGADLSTELLDAYFKLNLTSR